MADTKGPEWSNASKGMGPRLLNIYMPWAELYWQNFEIAPRHIWNFNKHYRKMWLITRADLHIHGVDLLLFIEFSGLLKNNFAEGKQIGEQIKQNWTACLVILTKRKLKLIDLLDVKYNTIRHFLKKKTSYKISPYKRSNTVPLVYIFFNCLNKALLYLHVLQK